MHIPSFPHLRFGDRVDIIAPGYGAKQDDVDNAITYLKQIGLTPHAPADLLGDDPLSSHSRDKRAHFLIDALHNPDAQAVWCLKGGYGTSELLPALAKHGIPKKPKLVIGFSDITALHSYIHQFYGWPTLHASVLWQIVNRKVDAKTIEATEQLIFGNTPELRMPLQWLSEPKPLHVKGSVVGGNMMLIQNSIGTAWQTNCAGSILFIEDIDESAYRIARVLTHFIQSGLLDECHAVLFGEFTFIDKREEQDKLRYVLQQFADSLEVPVLQLHDVGHGKTNFPLPLNYPGTLQGNDTAELAMDIAYGI